MKSQLRDLLLCFARFACRSVVTALAIGLACVFVISSARAEPGTALPLPNRAEAGAQTYCVNWAETAMYGVSKYLRTPLEARGRPLVFSYQTGEYDRAHPEVVDTTQQNGETHGLATLITDGVYKNGAAWFMSEAFQRWAEDVMVEGWVWAEQVAAKGGEPQLLVTPTSVVKRALHGVCMAQKDAHAAQGGAFRRTGSSDTTHGGGRCQMYVEREGAEMLAQKREGMTLEQMLNPAFFGPGSDPGYVNIITGMINLLFSSGTDDEWRAAALKFCQAAMGKEATGFLRVASSQRIIEEQCALNAAMAQMVYDLMRMYQVPAAEAVRLVRQAEQQHPTDEAVLLGYAAEADAYDLTVRNSAADPGAFIQHMFLRCAGRST